MQAIEFKAKVINNSIKIPKKFKSRLSSKGRSVRVILLLEENEDEKILQSLVQEQFLKGYSDSDAVYDNPV